MVAVRIAVKLIDFGLGWYEHYLHPEKEKKESMPDPAMVMLKHAAKLLVYVAGVSIGLSHFGLANNAISIVLIAIGVIVLLSIKDIITDVIYGFIILIGQPFREGDVVHIASMDAGEWGWVTEIGSRDTRIRTRDNRMLVVPNVNMGANEIANYTRPDPTYRVQTDLRVVYGSDADQVQSVLEQATRGVDGVLPDKPVEVLYWQFGASARIMRVRWWIATCEQDTEMIGKVNAALEAALSAANLQIAYATIDLNVQNKGPD